MPDLGLCQLCVEDFVVCFRVVTSYLDINPTTPSPKSKVVGGPMLGNTCRIKAHIHTETVAVNIT